MRIEHIALWTDDIERCKQFYASYFGAIAAAPYANPKKGFESCFLSFADGARIEVMKTTTLHPVALEPGAQRMGLTHFAVSLGSEQRVHELTLRLKSDGYPVLDGPRRTGDGYYESVVLASISTVREKTNMAGLEGGITRSRGAATFRQTRASAWADP